jgi:hypothetical protein
MPRFVEVNVTHRNDVGVWVCEAYGVLIGPGLFIETICPDNFPAHVSIKWCKPADSKRKYFLTREVVSLMYGDCGQIRQSYLHLFNIGESIALSFQEECVLSDLQFPVRMAGFVVLIERFMVEQLLEDIPDAHVGSARMSIMSFAARTLNWVKAHELPFVVAATGYDTPQFLMDEFRDYFALESDIPVVVGPSVDVMNKPAFDAGYAAHVLEVLSERIEM